MQVHRGPRSLHARTRALDTLLRTITGLGEPGAGETEQRLARIKGDLQAVRAGGVPTDRAVLAAADALREDAAVCDAVLRLVRGQRLRLDVRRCATFADWLDYEGLTAVPSGAVELQRDGAAAAEQVELADRALVGAGMLATLTRIGPHYRAGYIHLPQEDLREFGVDDSDLDRDRATPELRNLVAFETTRALTWLDSGSLVVSTLHGRARTRFASRVATGRATAATLRRCECDPLRSRVVPRAAEVTRAYLTALVRRPG